MEFWILGLLVIRTGQLCQKIETDGEGQLRRTGPNHDCSAFDDYEDKEWKLKREDSWVTEIQKTEEPWEKPEEFRLFPSIVVEIPGQDLDQLNYEEKSLLNPVSTFLSS